MLIQTSECLRDETSGRISVLVLKTTLLDKLKKKKNKKEDKFSNAIIPQTTSSLHLHLVNPFWVKIIQKGV